MIEYVYHALNTPSTSLKRDAQQSNPDLAMWFNRLQVYLRLTQVAAQIPRQIDRLFDEGLVVDVLSDQLFQERNSTVLGDDDAVFFVERVVHQCVQRAVDEVLLVLVGPSNASVRLTSVPGLWSSPLCNNPVEIYAVYSRRW